MRCLEFFAAAAALSGSALAQTTNVDTIYFPNQLPYLALQVYNATTNPAGYPQNPNSANWPVTMRIGDIDNDGRRDFLLCMEQRLLLALGLNLDSHGNPVSTYVIWARFARNGTINKTLWGADLASIGDFNGDGLNEVAAVVDPPGSLPAACGQSMRLQILGGTPVPDPYFGNVPSPQVLGEVDLDDAQVPFSQFLIPSCSTGGGPGQVTVGTFNYEGDAKARDIIIAESERGVLKIVRWDGTLNGFTTKFERTYQWSPVSQGSWTHHPYGVDLDGDGHDELLGQGVRTFFPTSCYWNVESDTQFATCAGSGANHADLLVPWDRDNDGVDEILVTHDCYDLVFEPNPGYCSMTLSPLATAPPTYHGQDATVMRLLEGADSFGYEGDCYVATPKGPPIYNGGNDWGSYVRNGFGNVLNVTRNTVNPFVVNGPNGWAPSNMDWDGYRPVDEVYTRLANRHSIWRLEVDNSPSPQYPYRWVEMGGFDDAVWGQYCNAAADVISDYREEVVTIGRLGMQIAGINALVQPWQHLSPFEDETYRRRHSGGNHSVDYRGLFKLDRLRVSPLTLATAPGTQTTFTVEGVYVNDAGEEQVRDVTAYAVFQISDASVGTFAGNILTSNGDGLAVVNAYLGGRRQEDVPMVLVGTEKPPLILHAGYADTYLSQAAGPQPLTVEVRVADCQNDVTAIVVNTVGQSPFAPPQAANDSGLAGDRRAGDGIWTLRMPSVAVVTPHDDYVEAVALDSQGNSSLRWPWLHVGAATIRFPGVANYPFASELITAAPPPLRLLGTGLYPSSLPTGGTGKITVFALCQDPRVLTIPGFAQNVSLPLGVNDLGQGADAYAGDGLWTGEWTISTPLVDGRHTLDLVPRNIPQALVGDVYPRLRYHN